MLRITGREDTAGIEEPGDDFALSTLCAITTELPNGTNSTMIVVKTSFVIKRRMVKPPEINAFIVGLIAAPSHDHAHRRLQVDFVAE
jgi:hypothetical protein